MSERRDQKEAPGDAPPLDGELIAALETILPRYFRAVRRAIEQAEHTGADRLTLAQYRCLQAIAAQGKTLTTHLAWQMGVTMPTMTSRIDGLVERGLVERQPDPQSRRQVLLLLTPAGNALLESYRKLVDSWLRGLLAGLGPAQKRQLFGGLQDLDKLLDADSRARAEQAAAVER
jgi:DNA-binding MarR family transcriptional regulator